MSYFEDRKDNLREFLAHLFLDCMTKYQNDTILPENVTQVNEFYFTSAPQYLEESVLNAGDGINIDEINQAAVEREELLASVTTLTAGNVSQLQTHCPLLATYTCQPAWCSVNIVQILLKDSIRSSWHIKLAWKMTAGIDIPLELV